MQAARLYFTDPYGYTVLGTGTFEEMHRLCKQFVETSVDPKRSFTLSVVPIEDDVVRWDKAEITKKEAM